MINIRILASALCLSAALYGNAANRAAFAPSRELIALADSLDDDDDDEPVDTATKTRRNLATEFNALKYVMERRYRGYNDQFGKRWDDHLFLEFGAGLHQYVQTGHADLSLLSTAHFGIGKQFSRLHTARISGGAGFGYYEGTKRTYQQVYGSIDWLYSLTTYMDGYRPSRLFDISTVLGVGLRYNSMRDFHGTRMGKEAHGGLSMRFFTGPQGYLVLEPYVGVSSRHLDRKYGMFYGANLNFVYYLHNNLSTEDRMRFMRNRPESVDSLLKPQAWRTPWFAEVTGGVTIFKGAKGSKTAPGHVTTLSIGRWLSPVIGLRLSGSLSTTTWQQTDETMGIADAQRREELGVPEQPSATRNNHNLNYDLRADALINPFGFTRGDSWDRPFGGYIVVGGGIGRLMKIQSQKLSTTATHYTAGIHAYYNLTNDLQLFVEPRYTNYNYKIPYTNINRFRRFSDDVISVNIGLTAYTRGTSFRKPDAEYTQPSLPLSFGVGGGTSLLFTDYSYKGSAMNFNGNVFAEYHFGKYHSARMAFEYMQMNAIAPQTYHASDLTGETTGYSAMGLFKHSYRRGFLSLNYMVNITNLCSGYQGRRLFEAEAFAGPTIMFAMGATHKADGSIRVKDDHVLQASFSNYTAPLMGANGGVKLKLNVAPHFAVTMTPQLHFLRYNAQLQGMGMNKFHGYETLDFGVQYDL